MKKCYLLINNADYSVLSVYSNQKTAYDVLNTYNTFCTNTPQYYIIERPLYNI